MKEKRKPINGEKRSGENHLLNGGKRRKYGGGNGENHGVAAIESVMALSKMKQMAGEKQ